MWPSHQMIHSQCQTIGVARLQVATIAENPQGLWQRQDMRHVWKSQWTHSRRRGFRDLLGEIWEVCLKAPIWDILATDSCRAGKETEVLNQWSLVRDDRVTMGNPYFVVLVMFVTCLRRCWSDRWQSKLLKLHHLRQMFGHAWPLIYIYIYFSLCFYQFFLWLKLRSPGHQPHKPHLPDCTGTFQRHFASVREPAGRISRGSGYRPCPPK